MPGSHVLLVNNGVTCTLCYRRDLAVRWPIMSEADPSLYKFNLTHSEIPKDR